MVRTAAPGLLTPITIKGRTLGNRIVMPPMASHLSPTRRDWADFVPAMRGKGHALRSRGRVEWQRRLTELLG